MSDMQLNSSLKNNIFLYIRGSMFLILILFCYVCSIFTSDFAENNIQFSFLNFPVFVGEILLFFLIASYMIMFKDISLKFNKWMWCILVYICFVLLKTYLGYFQWGPLALRNAALFYYPIVGLISYDLFDLSYFRSKAGLYVITLILVITALISAPDSYFIFTYLVCGVLLLLTRRTKVIKYIGILYFLLFPYKLLFRVHRGVLLSEVVAGFFLVISLISFIPLKRIYKILIAVSIVFVFFVGLAGFADKNAIRTLTNPQEIAVKYHEFQDLIEEKKSSAVDRNVEIKIYDKNKDNVLPPQRVYREEASRDLNELYKNIFWRLFLWKEIRTELLESKRLFGIDYGKPFRSKTAEILEWSAGDGWIEPHNSYVHMIYRSGIVGLVFIFGFLFVFVQKTSYFILRRDIKGVVLSSILLYWIIVSNFEVILELPYFAIPFWCLFGAMMKYANRDTVSDIGFIVGA